VNKEESRLVRRISSRAFFLLGALALVTGLGAQTAPGRRPQLGQPGKDVIWLPTHQILVEKMLDMARLTSQDVLMDLGSGDGRVVMAAARRGAQAIGIEYNPELVKFSRRRAAAQKLAGRATFRRADLFEVDLSNATVITLYLRLDLNLKLRPKLLNLRPGARVVSNTFSMDDWEPEEVWLGDRRCANCSAFLWIIPAKVQGTWTLADGEMRLTQTLQTVTGTLRTGTASLPIGDGRLRADRITFTAGDVRYAGHVRENTIEGTATTRQTVLRWTATRTGSSVR
jgi:hypothetical protein